MQATQQLSLLLTHHVAHDTTLEATLPFVLRLLIEERLVYQISLDSAENASVTLAKWNLRLSAVINTQSKTAGQRAAAFQLARESIKQVDSLLLREGKAWFNTALALCSKPSSSTTLQLAAIDFIQTALLAATHLPEFSRESANAAIIRKFAEDSIRLNRDGGSLGLRRASMQSLVFLLNHHASVLKPLAAQLQNLSTTVLCLESDLQESASDLLGHVYLSAGKAAAGTAWRRSVEGLVASINICLDATTTSFQDKLPMPNLSPLELPLLNQNSNASAFSVAEVAMLNMDRIECLSAVILRMLRTPAERAVPVPIGVLLQLVYKMLALNAEDSPLHSADKNIRMAEISNIPRLHLVAANLAAQLSMCVSVNLIAYSVDILSALSTAISTYSGPSPIRSSLAAAFSIILNAAPVDPDDGAKPANFVMRILLEDIIAIRTASSSNTAPAQTNGTRKAKKARIDNNDLMPVQTVVREETLATAELALSSLHRMLAFPFFSSKVITQALHLLLVLATSPDFQTSAATQSSAALASAEPLEIAFSRRPKLRLSILECLSATIATAGREVPDLTQRAIHIFSTHLSLGDEQMKVVCRSGLANCELITRPRVPPIMRSAAIQQMESDRYDPLIADLIGVAVPVDDEMEVDESNGIPTSTQSTESVPTPSIQPQPAIKSATLESLPEPAMEDQVVEPIPTIAPEYVQTVQPAEEAPELPSAPRAPSPVLHVIPGASEQPEASTSAPLLEESIQQSADVQALPEQPLQDDDEDSDGPIPEIFDNNAESEEEAGEDVVMDS